MSLQMNTVTCSLEHGIYTAHIIFVNTFGTSGVSALHSDNQNESIKLNFEWRTLNFGGGQLFEGVNTKLLFLTELLHDTNYYCNYIISDPFCINSGHFWSHKKRSQKIVMFGCPAL
jgi:hypothetical protein